MSNLSHLIAQFLSRMPSMEILGEIDNASIGRKQRRPPPPWALRELCNCPHTQHRTQDHQSESAHMPERKWRRLCWRKARFSKARWWWPAAEERGVGANGAEG